ncbi:Uma2 family endonuclease [Streptomyces sp. B-S-A8]|uniref:Uma2 family endonuclease n=1 Tax=Streptomyces solicavernae TaxID=3043614 RepID=A0ABT6RUM7_9ACTN|nr:Uma2 family endonuclease [Streptomyces sp. B-S-A8]MDI3388142.1 Uma2 family endonuclease [Streptomyces sp. B-S-A8]
MTVVETDRIEMAESNDERTLDEMFEWLERMPAPEGFKTEIVGGHIFMSPQRDTHWEIIFDILDQLRAKYPRKRLKSDVRIDYPGHLNGFATDITLLKDGAVKNAKGQWQCTDVEFVAEVISRSTGMNDYGPKKIAYAEAGVPVYLIVDPYQGRCLLCTEPKDGEYASERKYTFGESIHLTHTVVALALDTSDFPRD